MFNHKKYSKIKKYYPKNIKKQKNISSYERIILESYTNKIQTISILLRKFNVKEWLLMKILII